MVVDYCYKVLSILDLLGDPGYASGSSHKNSRSQMFFKIGALENSAIFTGKHL